MGHNKGEGVTKVTQADNPDPRMRQDADASESGSADANRVGDPYAAAIIASALDAIVVIDRHNLIREFNPAAERIFGWRGEQMVGRDLGVLIPPEFRDRSRACLQAYADSGEARVLDRRLELKALRADGTRFPIELSVSRFGPRDAPLFTAFIRDITLRREMGLQLLEHGIRLRGIVEAQRELAGLSTTSDALYDRIARIAQHAMNADGAAFEIPDGDELVFRATSGAADGAAGLRLPISASLSGQALCAGATLLCEDAETDARVDAAACRRMGLRSMIVSVLRDGDAVVGVIKVMSRRPANFNADDAAALEVFVASLSGVLARIGRQTRAETTAQRRTEIARIQQELASSDASVQHLMEDISRHAQALTGGDGAIVELLEGDEMVYTAASGSLSSAIGMRLPAGASLSGLAAREGRALVSTDTAADPRVNADAARKVGARSMVVAPLHGEAGTIGVLKVVSSRVDAFGNRDVDALGALAQSLGVVIQRRAAAERVAASERHYRMLFAHNPQPMWAYDMETLRFVEVNDAAIATYGYSREEFLARTILDIRPAEDRAELLALLARLHIGPKPSLNVRSRHQRKDGSLLDVEISGDDIELGGRRARLVLAHDVTARLLAEAQRAAAECERQRIGAALEHAATHDPLTGLPRYSVLQAGLDPKLARGEPFALLLVELDHFAAVNQTLSHDAADDVLRQIGERLHRLVSESVQVGHLAGDEFVVVTPAGDTEALARLAQDLRLEVARPVEVAGVRLNLTATVGIAQAPDHGASSLELLRRAEAAAERGKATGRDCVSWYSSEAMQLLDDRIHLGAHLRRAIERDELHLVYQPQFRSGDQRPVGYEALLRWSHPTLGEVSPVRFIPVAENLGLMTEIGDWVVEAACRQIRAWHDAGFIGFKVAVNVSSLQLQRPGLVAKVTDALTQYRVAASSFELEITESALMENLERARLKLQKFAALGVSVSLDDFGTGYSSLAYLKDLQLDKLKIDKSFVQGLPGDARDAAMARTIVSIAHQFGLSVAAEGVETQEQAAFLASIGCDLLQGYLLARPMPAEDVARLMQDATRGADTNRDPDVYFS